MGTTYYRAALGSSASLGHLYDIRSGDFCASSIFKSAIPDATIEIIPKTNIYAKEVHSDVFSDKFVNMEVDADLQISTFFGFGNLSASAAFLNHSSESSRVMKFSLICNVSTVHQDISLFDQRLKDLYSVEALQSGLATHVVVGVDWGAKSVMTCKYENILDKSNDEIKANLSTQLNLLWLNISNKVHYNLDDGSNTGGMVFELELYGDFIPDKLPTTFAEAVDLMQNMPKLLTQSSNKKGAPMKYTMLPIYIVQKLLHLDTPEIDLIMLADQSLNRMKQLIDDVARSAQKIDQFFQDVERFECCLTSDTYEEIRNFWNKTTTQIQAYKDRIKGLLPKIREGKEDTSKFDTAMDDFYKSDIAPAKVSVKLDAWKQLRDKLTFARILANNGVMFLNKGETLENVVLKEGDVTLCVLIFKNFNKARSTAKWNEVSKIFMREAEKHLTPPKASNPMKDRKYLAVDADISSETIPGNEDICIEVYQNRQLITNDLTHLPDVIIRNDAPEPVWVASSSRDIMENGIPSNAVLAGSDSYGNPVYVIKAVVENCVIPGSLVVSIDSAEAYVEYYGSFNVDTFEVLSYPAWACSWVQCSNTTPQAHPIPGGEGEDWTLLIGRANVFDGIFAGKIMPWYSKYPAFYAAYKDHSEQLKDNFQCLVGNTFGIQEILSF